MYAIMNLKKRAFVYGTDFTRVYNDGKTHAQRTSYKQMLTYADLEAAELDFKLRGCGKDYRIVVLKTVEVKRIIERRK